MLTKTKNQNKTEYLAFRLSSLLAFTGKTQPQDDDFSWINVFTKKDKEQFKNELYDVISKAIQANNWIIVEDLIDSWRETAEIMSDKKAMRSIKKSMEESELGEVSRWEDVQKKLKL
jgi:hypothetical protein